MKRWIKKELDESAKMAVRLTGHGVIILLALLVEGLVFYALQFPEFSGARPYVEPILKGALILTVTLLCVIFVSLISLSGWAQVRDSHDKDNTGNGGWIIVAVGVFFLAGASIIFLRTTPGTESRRPDTGLELPPPAEVATYDVALELPRRVRSGVDVNTTLRCPRSARRVKLSFFVPVQRGYDYFSQLDGGKPVRLDFQEDGLLNQVVSHSDLQNARHRLAIYRRGRDEVAVIEVDNYVFEVANDN